MCLTINSVVRGVLGSWPDRPFISMSPKYFEHLEAEAERIVDQSGLPIMTPGDQQNLTAIVLLKLFRHEMWRFSDALQSNITLVNIHAVFPYHLPCFVMSAALLIGAILSSAGLVGDIAWLVYFASLIIVAILSPGLAVTIKHLLIVRGHHKRIQEQKRRISQTLASDMDGEDKGALQ